jgi:hypothetical protein
MSAVLRPRAGTYSSIRGPKVPKATALLELMGYSRNALVGKLCLESTTALGLSFRLKRACGKTTIGSHFLKCDSDVESVRRPNR